MVARAAGECAATSAPVGLGDDEVAGRDTRGVELGQATQRGAVGTAGGPDEDGASCGESGHGHVLSNEPDGYNVRNILPGSSHQIK